MKGLLTLIKLQKHKLDELRRDLARLDTQRANLEKTSQRLREELERESALAIEDFFLTRNFGQFAMKISQRRAGIHDEIRQIEEWMDLLRDQIADAFGEQKRYEIAYENRKRREREELARREQMELDDIGMRMHEEKRKIPPAH
ncbi:MAG: flagellar FliJ family protein [Alphaproteobacteria bacterium]|nr:flagellar FliJ family protein [Alphaproteobacteria bacterium]